MPKRLIIITGPRGVGKTTLAGTYLPPDKVNQVYYHDSEDSANNLIQQLESADLSFGRYVDLKDRFSELPDDNDLLSRINQGDLPWVDPKQRSALVDYYQYILKDLNDNLTDGTYKVYVHDTAEKLESGMAAWVENNKRHAGVTTTAYGKLWTEGVYPLYESLFDAIYARGVETIIMVFHLKTPWEGNRPVVGKVVPSGKKLLWRLASLYLWLVNDARNTNGEPAALVLKERMGKLAAVNGQWEIKKMLPPRIPVATWAEINGYLKRGYDASDPDDREIMSADEKGMISELLTDEQMRLMILDAEIEKKKLEEQAVVESGGMVGSGSSMRDLGVDKNKILELSNAGGKASQIAKELEVPLPIVIKTIRDNS